MNLKVLDAYFLKKKVFFSKKVKKLKRELKNLKFLKKKVFF